MDFVQGDAVFLGICTDLSESGLRGTFSEGVSAGAEGLITLYDNEQPLQVRANVDSIRDSEVRMRFKYGSDKERVAMTNLVRSLAARFRR